MRADRNPFRVRGFYGVHVQAVDAELRIHMVKKFDAEKCRAALKVPGLQATVRQAIERRLRALGRKHVG